MIRFAAVRLLQAIPVLFGVITITFILIHSAPGGPFSADKAVPPEVLIALEEKYDLNLPLWQQYFGYLEDLISGDFGPSFKYPGRNVSELIASAFPTTELAMYSMLVAIIIGLFAGVVAAIRPNSSRLRADVCSNGRNLHAFISSRPIIGVGLRYLP